MEKKDLKIVFMGTPEFAVETLRTLVEGGYQVVAVVTQPDKPVGRHHEQLQAPPVKQYALEQGIPVMQSVKMKDPQFLEQLASYHADLQVVVAFRMLPEAVWAMPRWGTFNVHASLLPQYRGAAPIQWAIIHGDKESGVTTFFLDKDMDTGRIIMQKRQEIPDDANAEWLYDRLMVLGAEAACETINLLVASDGQIATTPQPDEASQELRPAPKIFKDTCRVCWEQPVKKVYDFIRGMAPHPGAWTLLKSGGGEQVLKIYQSVKTTRPAVGEAGTVYVEGRDLFMNCADGLLQLTEVQPAGKRRMKASDFLNGWRP